VARASCTGTPGSGAAGRVITLPSTVTNPFSLELNQTLHAGGYCVVTSGAEERHVILIRPMQPIFLGNKITVGPRARGYSGSKDTTVRACTILVAAIPRADGQPFIRRGSNDNGYA